MAGKACRIVALIPARGGSKGVPRKNIRPLDGFPLLAWSVAAALQAISVGRVIVSTDCEQIAEVARQWGGEAPFLRPSEFAGDASPDEDVVRHAVEWFQREEGWTPEWIVYLRPTTPLRDPLLIDEAVAAFGRAMGQAEGQPRGITSLRSAHELSEPPQKMFRIVDGCFDGFFPDDPRPEYFNLPRQVFDAAYHPNGYVDIVTPAQLATGEGLFGKRILPFVTPFSVEVDSAAELEYLEFLAQKQEHPLVGFLKAQSRSGSAQ